MTDSEASRSRIFLFWGASVAILLCTTMIRVWFVYSGQLNLAPDEAQYWDWSRTLQWSYYSKGPLIAVINRMGTIFWGPTELGVRLGAVIGSVGMQLLVLLWLGVHLRRIRAALWTLVILNTTALFMAGGVLMTTDNPLLLCWITGMICLSLALDKGKQQYFFLLAMAVGLGITAKYTMLAFIPLALVASFWIGRREDLPERFWPRIFKSLGFGGLLGFLPIFLWNAGNEWVGFKHVIYRGALAGEKAHVFFELKNFPEYVGSQLGVLTPWWFVFLMLGAGVTLRGLCSRKEQEMFGLSRSTAILLNVFFWPVWIFFVAWSLHAKVEANWSAVAYPAGIVLAALAFERYLQNASGKRLRWVWPGMGVLVFVVVHLQGLVPFDGSHNPVHRLRGWADLGQQVERVLTEELGGTEVAFAFSDEYGVTAGLSFYVPGQRRAFCVPGNRKMNQYDLWPGPGPEYVNAVLVMKGEKTRAPHRVQELFARIDPPRIVKTTHQGRTGQTFTLFLCRGYEGGWPEQAAIRF